MTAVRSSYAARLEKAARDATFKAKARRHRGIARDADTRSRNNAVDVAALNDAVGALVPILADIDQEFAELHAEIDELKRRES